MLPIGTIVYLTEGTSKLMILNRGPILPNEEDVNVMYDYSGCFYPQGLDANHVFYFNEENIDKVLFEGYKDEAEDRFQEIYNDWMKENETTIKKGTVSEALK